MEAFLGRGRALKRLALHLVADAMAPPGEADGEPVRLEDDLRVALAALMASGAARLPCVDADGRPQGTIDQAAIVRTLARDREPRPVDHEGGRPRRSSGDPRGGIVSGSRMRPRCPDVHPRRPNPGRRPMTAAAGLRGVAAPLVGAVAPLRPLVVASALFAAGAWAWGSGGLPALLLYREDVAYLLGQHVALVAWAGGLAILVGIPVGALLSRPALRAGGPTARCRSSTSAPPCRRSRSWRSR